MLRRRLAIRRLNRSLAGLDCYRQQSHLHGSGKAELKRSFRLDFDARLRRGLSEPPPERRDEPDSVGSCIRPEFPKGCCKSDSTRKSKIPRAALDRRSVVTSANGRHLGWNRATGQETTCLPLRLAFHTPDSYGGRSCSGSKFCRSAARRRYYRNQGASSTARSLRAVDAAVG